MSTYEPCVLGSDGNCTRWSHDHAADRPSVTDNARAEAERRYNSAVLHSDLTYPAHALESHRRGAFVAGAEWAAGRAETTIATTEDAEEVLHGAGWFARADLDPRDLRAILHDLADADLLATARTRPTREQVTAAIGDAANSMQVGFGVVSITAAVDAVLELLRGGDK